MFIKRLILLTLIIPTLTYATDKNLYFWSPLVHHGKGLYDDSSDKISGESALGLLGVHYRISTQWGVTLSTYKFSDYEANGHTYCPETMPELVGKYYPDRFIARLGSKTINIYGQLGIWHARVVAFQGKSTQDTPWLRLTGSGIVTGIGGYCDLSSWFFLDVSWKRLWAVPIYHTNMHHTQLLSFGFGIRLL